MSQKQSVRGTIYLCVKITFIQIILELFLDYLVLFYLLF